jgi:hypothetical protein
METQKEMYGEMKRQRMKIERNKKNKQRKRRKRT